MKLAPVKVTFAPMCSADGIEFTITKAWYFIWISSAGSTFTPFANERTILPETDVASVIISIVPSSLSTNSAFFPPSVASVTKSRSVPLTMIFSSPA